MATPAFHQPGRLLTRRVGRLCLEGHSWDPRDPRTGLSLDRQANRTHDNPFHEGIPASHGCANRLDERSWKSGSYFVLVYVCPALSSRERERPGVERRIEIRRFDHPQSRIEQMDGREPAAASWMDSRPRLEISPRRRPNRLAGWRRSMKRVLSPRAGRSFRNPSRRDPGRAGRSRHLSFVRCRSLRQAPVHLMCHGGGGLHKRLDLAGFAACLCADGETFGGRELADLTIVGNASRPQPGDGRVLHAGCAACHTPWSMSSANPGAPRVESQSSP
jgi:hypothetical protein